MVAQVLFTESMPIVQPSRLRNSIFHARIFSIWFRILDRSTHLKDQFFDVIVASNSLEHVEGVEKFFFSAVRLLKPSGVLMIAVPIVRNQEVVAEQLSNPFHVNLWSAGHWYRTLTSYFREVECHAHLFNSAESPELDTRSAVATFRENDFLFPAVELEDLTRLSAYTSIL